MTHGWRERFADSVGAQAPGLVDGNASDFGVFVQELHLFGGSSIVLPTVGVTVVVGPNNAGKSTLIREMVAEIQRHPGHPEAQRLIVHRVALAKRGQAKDAIAWIGDHSTFVVTPQQAIFQGPRGLQLNASNVNHAWQQAGAALGEFAGMVLHYGHAQDRFSFGGSIEMRASIDDPPIDPVHHLQDDRVLLDSLSDITEAVFGQRLTLDTLGRTIRLRVGTLLVDAPPVDNISSEYREAMSSLPVLDAQGDGMRGFLGQLLPLVTSSFKVIALDEPEAFLHPPQAYGLGQQLGRLAVRGQVQVLVATHDRNLLAGLLDSNVPVSVVRLAREGPTTIAKQLDPERLAELWHDPVLRYTNVLDGLFHRAVVLAEAEADCGYFGAAADAALSGEPTALAGRELLFVPTGGKDGMPRVAKSLTAVGVPVVATADLDLLNDERKLAQLVEAVGGTWSDTLSALYQQATHDLRQRREPATVSDVRAAIDNVLRDLDSDPFTPELQAKVNAQIRTQGSRWQPVKDYGVMAFKGSARLSLDRLMVALDSLGVVLVKAGELERLAPEVNVRKGPEWLPAALRANAHRNPETQAHLDRLRRSVAGP